jgi:hypothetical protein
MHREMFDIGDAGGRNILKTLKSLRQSLCACISTAKSGGTLSIGNRTDLLIDEFDSFFVSLQTALLPQGIAATDFERYLLMTAQEKVNGKHGRLVARYSKEIKQTNDRF